MAHYVEERCGYSELKADLSPKDAQILERLVERRASPTEVVGDLVVNEHMTQSDAYLRVRRLLLNCMDRLHRRIR